MYLSNIKILLIGANALAGFATITPAAARFATVRTTLTARIVRAGAVFARQTVRTAVRTTHTRVCAVVCAIVARRAATICLRKKFVVFFKIVLFKVSFKHNF